MRRRVVIVAVVLDLTAPAAACPPLESCLVQLRSTTRAPVASAHGPAAEPTFDLTSILREVTVRRHDAEIEMPWIWQALRTQVYSRMPAYEQQNQFTIMLAPVVVTSPSDTVPGVGVAGHF